MNRTDRTIRNVVTAFMVITWAVVTIFCYPALRIMIPRYPLLAMIAVGAWMMIGLLIFWYRRVTRK